MRKFILYILVFYPLFLISQNQTDPLQDMQGLEQNGNLFFEINGYIINVVTHDKKFNNKEINKILKRYDIKNPQKQYSDSTLNRENIIVETESASEEYPSVTLFKKFHFFPVGTKQIQHISFQSTLARDTVLEDAFMKAFNDNLLDKYIVCREYSTQSINFVGRKIELGARCNWMFVNNLQCPGNGQMNWAIFQTMEEAQKRTELQQLQNSSRKILKNEKINILFEGVPHVATRIVYKFNIPSIIMGGSNLLAVYYVTSQVRGKYVSCTLSNYINDKDDYYIAPLLQEVMSLEKADK